MKNIAKSKNQGLRGAFHRDSPPTPVFPDFKYAVRIVLVLIGISSVTMFFMEMYNSLLRP